MASMARESFAMNRELAEWESRITKAVDNGSLYESHAKNRDYREGLLQFYDRVESRIAYYDRRMANLGRLLLDGILDKDEELTDRIAERMAAVKGRKAIAVRIQMDVEDMLEMHFTMDLVGLGR